MQKPPDEVPPALPSGAAPPSAAFDSAEHFRALIEHSADAICLFDETGMIRYANPATRRIAARDPSELFGADGWKLIHPEDWPAMAEALARVLAHPGESIPVPIYRFMHPDGGWRWLESTSTNLLHLPAVRAIVGNYRDVTARMELEEKLRQTQKMEAIGLLAGGVAHDFNNLLTVMLGSAESMDAVLPAESPAREDLANIIKAGRSAAELTQKLLTFARRQVRVSRPFDLRETLLGFGGLIRRVVGEDVEVDIDAPEPLPMLGDEGQVQQLLLNLVTNARQAMPQGGSLRLRARRLVPPGDSDTPRGELEVADSGAGMDEQTRARIFDPFFTTRAGGTGLGMPVVLAVVQDHGGSIDVQSEPGRGTTVRVVVPLREGPLPSAASVSPPERLVARGSETLLVVEDETPVRDLLARALPGYGYTVLTASDGEEALAIFRREGRRISLVVMDVVMPRMDGPETLRRMIAVRPDLKAVLMSGYAPDGRQIADLLAPGRVALIRKPFLPGSLAAEIRRLLDG